MVWTFQISPCSIGPNCKRKDPMNAFRKGFRLFKSHPAILALIVREMTLGMP